MSVEKLEEYITAGDVSSLNILLTRQPGLAKSLTSYAVSPLMLSCYYKKTQVTALLLRYLDEITLFEAAAAGRFDVLAQMVQAHPEVINEYAEDGFTPLGLTCYFGHEEAARYLVLKGADVNMPSGNGYRVMPLHSATAGNFTNIARMLIESGAVVNVMQQAGVTPLHSAAQNGNIELIILLLEHGADINVRMEGGKLPADLALEKGFKEIAEILS